MLPNWLRKPLAFGSGVGIEIVGRRGAESLRIAAVRVRPGGARVLGQMEIADLASQRASTWGTDYAAFLRKHHVPHAVATVVLARHDTIVRPLSMPGVEDKDLDAAIQFQMENLHPHNDDDVVAGWERLPGTAWVLVAIARRDTVERYAAMFSEAGIKVGGFTCSPALLWSARRLFADPTKSATLALNQGEGAIEVYGESSSRPLYSATFHVNLERAVALASAELRFAEGEAPVTVTFDAVTGVTPSIAASAGLLSACPRHGLQINLLPASLRFVQSRLAWVPAAVLGTATAILAIVAILAPSVEDRRYNASIEKEISRVAPLATRAVNLDKQSSASQTKIALLSNFRTRPKADLEILAELTRLLPPPTWLTQTEIGPQLIVISGETDQAAALLRILDASPYFEGSEFTAPPLKVDKAESFHIRTRREAGR